jgi:hypothetical protein
MVRVVKAWHWRGGDRWSVRCTCGMFGPKYRNREAALALASGHAVLYGGRVESGAGDG